MTRTIANVDGASSIPHRFAEFVSAAIDRAGAIKSVAVRWGVPEESIRRYRDGNQSPAFERLCEFRLNAEERLHLCRILGANMISIEPLSADEADRRRQSGMVGVTGHELEGMGDATTRAAVELAEEIHEALADGQVEPAEWDRIVAARDRITKVTGGIGPWLRIRIPAAVRNLFGRS